MGYGSFFDAAIEKKLLDLHCAYIGKVLSTNGETATVQPLGLIKEIGGTAAKTQAVVSNVPIACQKVRSKTIYYTDSSGDSASQSVAVLSQIAKGDIVVCLCADRDITAARRGKNELPPAGHHSISDSIIVGVL